MFLLAAIMIMGTSTFAQDKSVKKQNTKQKATTSTPAATKQTQVTDTKGAKTKKDGTPDMRHKENKAAAAPAQKLKKDGTPDMRYKQNKEAAKKK